jgi:hypothetical protein
VGFVSSMIEAMSALSSAVHADEDTNQNLTADYTDQTDFH